jgi:hypothetical protein
MSVSVYVVEGIWNDGGSEVLKVFVSKFDAEKYEAEQRRCSSRPAAVAPDDYRISYHMLEERSDG